MQDGRPKGRDDADVTDQQENAHNGAPERQPNTGKSFLDADCVGGKNAPATGHR